MDAKSPVRVAVRAAGVCVALAAATATLSGLSACAGVVLAPKTEIRLKQLSFVPLAVDRALAVLVGMDGSVENRVVPLTPGKRVSINQDAEVQIMAWAGNLTCSGAQFQGRLLFD